MPQNVKKNKNLLSLVVALYVPQLCQHNDLTYYAPNYAGIICQGILPVLGTAQSACVGFWEVLREIFEALKFRGLTAYRKHS